MKQGQNTTSIYLFSPTFPIVTLIATLTLVIFKTIFTDRVPEDKCHMVLPEIEEEDEENHRLSLTSLLLGQEPPALPHPRTWLRS